MKFQPKEPSTKTNELRAAVAAKAMTEDEATDALFAWAQSVDWTITRYGAMILIRGESISGDC
jgi:hypothetical protein